MKVGKWEIAGISVGFVSLIFGITFWAFPNFWWVNFYPDLPFDMIELSLLNGGLIFMFIGVVLLFLTLTFGFQD